MGVAGLIIGTLGTAYLQGRAAREQAEAQAAQAEANARLQAREAENAARNAEKANKQAEELARIATENAEHNKRIRKTEEGRIKAAASASGLVNSTGNPVDALRDFAEADAWETRTQLHNGLQDSWGMFGQATDYANQSNKYKYNAAVEQNNAANYRAAGKRAEMNSWLMGGLSLASSLSGIGGGGSSSASGTTGDTWTFGGKTFTENWGSASNLRLRR